MSPDKGRADDTNRVPVRERRSGRPDRRLRALWVRRRSPSRPRSRARSLGSLLRSGRDRRPWRVRARRPVAPDQAPRGKHEDQRARISGSCECLAAEGRGPAAGAAGVADRRHARCRQGQRGAGAFLVHGHRRLKRDVDGGAGPRPRSAETVSDLHQYPGDRGLVGALEHGPAVRGGAVPEDPGPGRRHASAHAGDRGARAVVSTAGHRLVDGVARDLPVGGAVPGHRRGRSTDSRFGADRVLDQGGPAGAPARANSSLRSMRGSASGRGRRPARARRDPRRPGAAEPFHRTASFRFRRARPRAVRRVLPGAGRRALGRQEPTCAAVDLGERRDQSRSDPRRWRPGGLLDAINRADDHPAG